MGAGVTGGGRQVSMRCVNHATGDSRLRGNDGVCKNDGGVQE